MHRLDKATAKLISLCFFIVAEKCRFSGDRSSEADAHKTQSLSNSVIQ